MTDFKIGCHYSPIGIFDAPSLFWNAPAFQAKSSAALERLGEFLKQLDRNTALMVIDMQKGFDDAGWGARNNPAAEGCVARLLKCWRDADCPVIHIHHTSTSLAGRFRAGTAGHEPKAQAVPGKHERVYLKQVNSAFIGTTLEPDLRRSGIEQLVVTGLTTNHCVSTTVRMAGNLGFTTYVVADATATFDRAGGDGTPRCAQDVHNAALGDLHDEFAQVVDTESVIFAMKKLRINY